MAPVAPLVTRTWVVGVDVQVVEAGEFMRDGVAEEGDALHGGVDVVAGADGVDGGFDDGVRRIGIADALRHVDAAGNGAGGGHGADLGLNQVGGEFAEAEVVECGGRVGHRERRAKGAPFILPKYCAKSWQVRNRQMT